MIAVQKIIGLVGRTGAGKSSISRIMADEFNLPVYNVGRFERAWFGAQGFDSPIEYHRKLGIEVTYFGLFPQHMEQIRRSISEEGIIIESIYSPRLVSMLSDAFPNHSISILGIAATRHFRFNLFRKRNPSWPLEKATREFEELERFKIRFGMLEMLRRAAVVIRNDSSLESLREKVAGLNGFLRS